MIIKEGRVMKGCVCSQESLPYRPAPPAPNKVSKQMTNERLRQSIEQLTKDTAAERIEVLEAEIKRLKKQLLVESEPSPYCPICGSCGDEGCCGPKRCLYPAAEWQAGYKAGVEAAVEALEADAKKCDCFARNEGECGCGAWCEWKSITSARAVEIVRALAGKQ